MTMKIDWTVEAKKQRDELIENNPRLRNYFAATYQSLMNGEIRLPTAGRAYVSVEFTNYKFLLDIETDRIAKIKFVDIESIK